MPIFTQQDLTADDLRERYVHGKTQNPNEVFNNCIWRKAPKDTSVARKALEIAVSSVFLHFNDGCSGIIRVMEDLAITPGHYTVTRACCSNKKRIFDE